MFHIFSCPLGVISNFLAQFKRPIWEICVLADHNLSDTGLKDNWNKATPLRFSENKETLATKQPAANIQFCKLDMFLKSKTKIVTKTLRCHLKEGSYGLYQLTWIQIWSASGNLHWHIGHLKHRLGNTSVHGILPLSACVLSKVCFVMNHQQAKLAVLVHQMGFLKITRSLYVSPGKDVACLVCKQSKMGQLQEPVLSFGGFKEEGLFQNEHQDSLWCISLGVSGP